MITKYLIPLVAIISFGGGSLFGTKMLAPKPPEIPPCPDCKCPPAVEVDLQNFDLGKLNNKKGSFTYAPSLHNVTVKIDASDSVLIKQILKQAR
jgi:hypothetical protein